MITFPGLQAETPEPVPPPENPGTVEYVPPSVSDTGTPEILIQPDPVISDKD